MSNYIIDYLTNGSVVGMEKSAAGVMRGLGRIGRKYFPTFTRRILRERRSLYPGALRDAAFVTAPIIGTAALGTGLIAHQVATRNEKLRHSTDIFDSAEAWRDYNIEHGMDPDEAQWQYHRQLAFNAPRVFHFPASEIRDEQRRKANGVMKKQIRNYTNANKPVPQHLRTRYRRAYGHDLQQP